MKVLRTASALIVFFLAWPGAAAAQTAADSLRRILLPAPTGPHEVGVTRFTLSDASRIDSLAVPPAERRVVVSLWYPATIDSSSTRRPYMDEPTARALSENQGLPVGFEKIVEGHVFDSPAPIASEASERPLLLFSHGLSWPVWYYQVILADIASKGYVVAAIEHTHGADPVVFPSGEVVPWGLFAEYEESIPNAALWQYVSTWRDDLLFALSRLLTNDIDSVDGRAVLEGIDLKRVGAFGHSYGGTAAVLAAERSTVISGAVNLEGGAYQESEPYAVSAPTLFVVGGVNALELSATQFVSGKRAVIEAIVRGATHGSFSDLMILWRSYSKTMGPSGRIHPSRATSVSSALVVNYFEGLFSSASLSDLEKVLRMGDVSINRPRSRWSH